ncbi:MAG: DMT family transporter [Candidatus Puniceispirillaceae bacterium]
MPAHKTGPTLFDWALLALLGLIWGAAFFGVEMGLDSLPPLWVSTGRIVLAAILLTAIAFIWGDGLPGTRTALDRRVWLHCFGMGMFTNAIPFSLLAWGQQIVSSGFAGITMAVVPLLVLPLSHFLVPNERMTPARLGGFVIGFAGVVLLIGGDRLFANMETGGQTMMMAQLACVLASCCYACGSIITRLCPPVSTLSFAAAGLICAAVVLLPLALYVEGLPAAISPRALGGVLFLALLPTGMATIMLTVLIRRAGPPFLSLVNYQVPIWAVLIGVVILSETLPGHFVTALIVILGGVAISQFADRLRRA